MKTYVKWRAGSLVAIYALIALHIAHWKFAGTTLAPLEFSEVLRTLHQGIITAGFVFMGLAVISTMIFGRFFCGWGCHMLAVQDLSAWLLKKAGIKPIHVRSKAFQFVPTGMALYLFVWPQLSRLIHGMPFPGFRVINHFGEHSGFWSSFLTDNLWRNLPGFGIAATTFFVCGLISIAILGSRSFCHTGCPYGALFSLASKTALGKIQLRGDCNQCGKCTATCKSGIAVHKEILNYGSVVASNCQKDLDCVTVCPSEAIQFDMSKPFRGNPAHPFFPKSPQKPEFTWTEEGILSAGTLLFFLIFRGLYDAIPILLAITIAVILAYFLLTALRMFRRESVRFNGFLLKQRNTPTRNGKVFIALSGILLFFTIQSAWVRSCSWLAESAYERVLNAPGSPDPSAVESAIRYLERASSASLFRTARQEGELASLYLLRNQPEKAEPHLLHLLEMNPTDSATRERLARIRARGH